MERPVIKFEKPEVREVVRPILRFGDEPEVVEAPKASGGRPVLHLEANPDESDTARFARFRRMDASWKRVVEGRAS